MGKSNKGEKMTGIEKIKKEQDEQRQKHGFTIERDREINKAGELYEAALFALTLQEKFYPGGWDEWFKNKLWGKNIKERLAIAGALIASELDRMG